MFPATLDALVTADLETDSVHQTLRRLGLHPTIGSSVLTARTADQDAPGRCDARNALMLLD
ncbi:hypothetical protein [Streptomyces sp. NPDC001816]|uniref:hypothetical protein n=1 Tax=Streptomyces sp. NPDC001816 TaxID=3364612 RepID=UPI0036A81360